MNKLVKVTAKKIIKPLYKLSLKVDNRKGCEKIPAKEAISALNNKYQPLPYSIDTENKRESKTEYDLSIIIPVYNSKMYIEKCVDSLLNQETIYKYEILLINDGSTDDTPLILKKYENNTKIKVINQVNQGISNTRNRGIELSQGKYIGFIDNDDYVDSTYIETLLSRAMETNADIVKCGHCNFDSNGILDRQTEKAISIKGTMKNEILNYNGFIWGGIIKNNLFESFKFPPKYWFEDMTTKFILYRMCHGFEYIDKPLYYKRNHKNNAAKVLWSKENFKCLDQYYLVEKLLKISNQIGLPEDENLYRLLLSELGTIFSDRSSGLSNADRKNIFVICVKMIEEHKPSNYMELKKLFSEKEKLVDDAFSNGKFKVWDKLKYYNKIMK